MSWTPHSDQPFINAQKAIIDPSGWADQFRDGQKLRQEYEARQQQKALNELSQEGDFNARLGKARAHKYAGALVPMIQKQEQDRLIAEQTYNQGQADINKTNAEVGKIGAEQGEIGAKTTGLVRENTAGVQNDISALAVTQNPKLFALGIGEMVKQKLINPERADMMLKMVATDQPNAAAVLQAMVMANPELAKLFKPEVTYTNLGDRVESQVYDPLANTVTGKGGYNIGQSPDNKATNATSRANNINTVEGQKYASDNTYEASVYGTDVRSSDTRYNTDVTSHDRGLKLNQDGQIAWAKTSIDQQNANTNQIKAETAQQREQKAKAKMPARVQNKFLESKNKARGAYRQVQEINKWQKELEGGGIDFSGWNNTKNVLAAKTGINSKQAAKYTEFTAFVSSFVNEKLANASGVQTDNDEIRFWKEVTGTGGVPRTNEQAASILNRLKKYSLNEQKTYYGDMRAIGNQYGANIPEYGQSSGKTGSKSQEKPKAKTQNDAGASIIGHILGKKIFGGG